MVAYHVLEWLFLSITLKHDIEVNVGEDREVVRQSDVICSLGLLSPPPYEGISITGWRWTSFSSCLAGKLGGQDSFESIESYDSCDRLAQSWSSQSSFQSLQRVPSYDSFDSEDYPVPLPNHKPKGTFKDYVRDRSDMNKDKPVIPAAALAGYTGKMLEKRGWYKQFLMAPLTHTTCSIRSVMHLAVCISAIG